VASSPRGTARATAQESGCLEVVGRPVRRPGRMPVMGRTDMLARQPADWSSGGHGGVLPPQARLLFGLITLDGAAPDLGPRCSTQTPWYPEGAEHRCWSGGQHTSGRASRIFVMAAQRASGTGTAPVGPSWAIASTASGARTPAGTTVHAQQGSWNCLTSCIAAGPSG